MTSESVARKEPYCERTAENLMVEYQSGDEIAFAEIFRRYSARVYGFLSKRLPPQLLDDVFQSVFMKLHSSRSRYKSDYAFEAWLFTIAKTVVVDHRRSEKPVLDDEIMRDGLFRAEEKREKLSDSDLGEAVSALSSRQANAIRLRYETGLDFDEIADALGVSSSNARQIVSRGIRSLKLHMTKKTPKQ